MNLHIKISEVKSHIDKLQETANKHKANNKKQCYDIICQTLEENKIQLKQLYEDQKRNNRIILHQIHREQVY